MWKKDWQVTKARFERWWNREDMILSNWGSRFPVDREVREAVKPATTIDYQRYYTEPEYMATWQRYELARSVFPADMLPFIYCDKGTVSLAPLFGASLHFSEDTIWYSPPADFSPEQDFPLVLREDNDWWIRLQELVKAGKKAAGGEALCGMPSVSPGLDVLAELRGAQNLCLDLVQSSDWVKNKLAEIDEAAIQATGRLYDLCRDDDGWVFHAHFMIWAPASAALNQCDFAALISPEMFREFAVPSIRKYAKFLDYCLYHVDGPQALHTVDPLLEIEELDCIEFTPGPQVPQGGDPCWYDLYHKIKQAGKCVQAVEMQAREVLPLLDAVGPEGMYLMVNFKSEQEIEKTEKAVEPYRKSNGFHLH